MIARPPGAEAVLVRCVGRELGRDGKGRGACLFLRNATELMMAELFYRAPLFAHVVVCLVAIAAAAKDAVNPNVLASGFMIVGITLGAALGISRALTARWAAEHYLRR